MGTRMPEDIEMLMEHVAVVSEVVYNEVMERFSGTGFFTSLVKKEGNTPAELEQVMDEFMEENVGRLIQVLDVIMDDRFMQSYINIGISSVMSMGSISEVLFGDDSPHEFGIKMVETNVYYAILQMLNNFPQINFNMVHHLSVMDMEQANKIDTGHDERLEEIVRELLVRLEKDYTPDENLFSVMTANQFVGFIADKLNSEKVEEKYLPFERLAQSIIDVDEELGEKVAKLNIDMFQSKVERGEVNPMMMYTDTEAVVGSFLDYVMTITLETFHHMVMDGKDAEEVNIRGVLELIDLRQD